MRIRLQVSDTNENLSAGIYGQFIEHALDCIEGGIFNPEAEEVFADGIRCDVVDQIKKINPSIIRYPGGTVCCQYHWEDCIGPKESRKKRKNLIWGGQIDPGFGTAEFIQFCREVGAEPMICVNMASGSPEEAAHWVEYCNGTEDSYYTLLRKSHGYEEPFQVKYWCIGNECYAEPDIGVYHDVDKYCTEAKEYVKWMKLTDPTIKIIVVGCSDRTWNEKVLDSLHEMTDYLSLHFYASSDAEDYYVLFKSLNEFERMVLDAENQIKKYPLKVSNFNKWYRFPPREDRIKLAIDEWNIWNMTDTEDYGFHRPFNWGDALWVASMLNIFISNPAIEIANMAQLVNVMGPITTVSDRAYLQTIAYPLIEYRKIMIGSSLTKKSLQVNRAVIESDRSIIEGTGDISAISAAAIILGNRKRAAIVNIDKDSDYEVYIDDGDTENPGKLYVTILEADSVSSVCTEYESCVRKNAYEVARGDIVIPKASICFVEWE